MSNYTARHANENDIPDILSLVETRGNKYLKARTAADIRNSIQRDEAVVITFLDPDRDDPLIVVAYFEAQAIVVNEETHEERERKSWAECTRQLACHDGDLLLFWGGFVALEDHKGKGIHLVAGSFIQQTSSAIVAQTLARRHRVTAVMGTMAETKEMSISITHRWLRDILPAEGGDDSYSIFQREFPMVMPDGSGRKGFLIYFHVDPSMTKDQTERLSRNCVLIRQENEQRRLMNSCIGIVGLSTGSVVLETLLREGVGGTFKLADHDIFELSNANRMLFGPSDVGRSKVELCQERLHNLDPALRVQAFPNGINKENLEDFVKGCDLIVEECDDFAIKLLLRTTARKFKVPVVMGTSQNGMIDIERYDVDPRCRPFHLEDGILPAAMMSGDEPLSADSKTALLTKMFSKDQFSPRMLEALPQVGDTIPSWPQLAEEVTLNAATVTHVVRRILLGDNTVVSGRFGIRLNELFRPENRWYPSSKI